MTINDIFLIFVLDYLFQDAEMFTKDITKQGLTSATLKYLKVGYRMIYFLVYPVNLLVLHPFDLSCIVPFLSKKMGENPEKHQLSTLEKNPRKTCVYSSNPVYLKPRENTK